MRFTVVIPLVAAFALSACDSDPCGYERMAEIMAEKFVKRDLRDPASAEFRQVTVRRHQDDGCIYSVTGRFSARNGFGGMTPGSFSVEMHKVRGQDTWRAEKLVIR